jgi:hypothetical protein
LAEAPNEFEDETEADPDPAPLTKRRAPARTVRPPTAQHRPVEVAPVGVEPPAAPREITRAIRWRTWLEPQVRIWWLATLALMFIIGWFLVDQTQEYLRERRLITQGLAVTATIVDVNGNDQVGHNAPPGSPVRLGFQHNGQTVYVSGVLVPHGDSGYVTVGNTVPIHVNPDDLSDWTDSDSAEPMTRRTIAGMLIVPVAALAALTAVLRRQRFLRTWRDGRAEPFQVVDSRQSSLAPRSHAIRCASSEGRDQSLVTVFVPNDRGNPQPGDVLWLIHPPGKPKSALAAMAYLG